MKELQKNEIQAFSFTPNSLEEAMKYAKVIADSDLAPKDYKGKPGNVLVALQMGHELGLKPMQAIQNIAVINGRPSLWGDALLAIVRSHPDFEYIKEWQEGSIAYCSLKRKNQDEKTMPFSKEQAKTAGLWGKAGPWTTYPERMLQMRARAFCCRDVFPDALKGIYSAEESKDIPYDRNQYEVVDKKTSTNLLNDKINSYLPEKEESPDWEKEFSACENLKSLQDFFNANKNSIPADKLDEFIRLKEVRKKELKSTEDISTDTHKIYTNISKMSSNEWVKEFDETTGEIK